MPHDDTREQRLLAYLDGELSEAERAGIEREIAADPSLRAQLEQLREALEAVRQWNDEPVPGIEHAEQIAIPRLRPAQVRDIPRRQVIRSYVNRAAALAAVFIIGVAVGSLQRAPTAESPERAIPEAVQVVATPAPTPEEVPHYTTDEDGRVIVQTVGRDTGTRATWIVDGKFQLAQSGANRSTL